MTMVYSVPFKRGSDRRFILKLQWKNTAIGSFYDIAIAIAIAIA